MHGDRSHARRRRSGPTAVGGGRAAGGGRPGLAGAPPSNTAPANSNTGGPNGTRIVGAGIDSLYLSYPGTLKLGVQSLLEVLKEQAQSWDPELRSLAQYPLLDWIFEVSPKGARLFSYVLTDSRFRIELAKATSANIPLAHVQVSSAALAAYGPERVVGDLQRAIEELADNVGAPSVSRADLFVDAVTACDLSELDDRQLAGDN